MVGSEGCFYAKTSPQATRSDGSCCPAGSCRITGEPLLLLLNVFFPREFSCSSIGLITMSWKIHGVVYVITFISLFLSNNKHFPINISPFQTQQHENFFLAFISINLDYELNCISCPWICVVPPTRPPHIHRLSRPLHVHYQFIGALRSPHETGGVITKNNRPITLWSRRRFHNLAYRRATFSIAQLWLIFSWDLTRKRTASLVASQPES